MSNLILEEAQEKVKREVLEFIGKNEGVSMDAAENVIMKWSEYEKTKLDHILGLIRSCENRINTTHGQCTYQQTPGEGFFQKCDYFIRERAKVLLFVSGFLVTASVFLLSYNVGQFVNKLNAVTIGLADIKLTFTEKFARTDEKIASMEIRQDRIDKVLDIIRNRR